MDLKQIIKNYREHHSLTMDELSVKCDLSKGYISMLEKGVNPRNNKPIVPTLTTLKKLSIGLSMELDELMQLMNSDQLVKLDKESAKKYKPSKRKGVKIPVLGHVAAGVPIEAVEDILDYEEITEELARTGNFFCLQIKGDSMLPDFKTGDVVVVRQQPNAETGDIVIATVNGSNATCKRLQKYNEGIALISSNPVYEPMRYTQEEIQNIPITIIGKVIELRRKY